MLTPELIKRLKIELAAILNKPAHTYELKEDGTAERVFVTVPELSKDNLLKLAELTLRLEREIVIRSSDRLIHVAIK